MIEDHEESTSITDLPAHRDYTRLLKSYGYDAELVDMANNILYSQTHRVRLHDKADKMDKMVLEAIWKAHQSLGRTCDPHLIRITIGKPSMRLKKRGDENVVVIHKVVEYVRYYLEHSFFNIVPDDSRERMIVLAQRLDEDDGLVELVTLQATAIIRHIMDEDRIEYKKESFCKVLGKTISSVNSACQQLKTWMSSHTIE